MSHADDGVLHAYLDGELTPVEIERLELHLAECAGCRARLDEERALVEQAARLLGMAVPSGPERVAPPLHQLRPPRPTWLRLRTPLAWAATIVLAVGLGWYAGRQRVPPSALEEPASPVLDVARAPVAPTETRSVPPAADRLSKAADAERGGPPPPAALGALADPPARAESDLRQAAQPAPQLPSDEARPGLRRALAPAPAANEGIDMTEAAPTAAARGRAVRLSTTWPLIEPQPARDLLGTAPVAIPGHDVRALRRNPSASREVVVEQEIAGVVVSLFERPIHAGPEAERLDAQGRMVDSLAVKASANERLARFVGGLRVEISGPLSTDSLSKLLQQVQ
jgi:hypothetical protein